MDGLRELIDMSKGISINTNIQNYTCMTPEKTVKVVDILSKEDPTIGLSCCDYQKEYFDSQSKLCERCKAQDLCSDLSDNCKGEKTNYLTCNKCEDGYAVNPYECQ
eukprot:Awhi_evm1s13666